MENCIFCKIISGEIPSFKIYEDDHLVVVLDIFPAHPGQLLLIPKEHKTFIWELNKETLHKLFEAAALFAKALGKIYPSVTIYSPNGPYAGQRVPHAAIYIIPRQENDQNKVVMAWQREQLSEDQAKEWVEKIKKALEEAMKDWELTISSPINTQTLNQNNPPQTIPNVPTSMLPLNISNPLKQSKPSQTQVGTIQSQSISSQPNPQKSESKKTVHEDIDKKLEIIKKWLKKEI